MFEESYFPEIFVTAFQLRGVNTFGTRLQAKVCSPFGWQKGFNHLWFGHQKLKYTIGRLKVGMRLWSSKSGDVPLAL